MKLSIVIVNYNVKSFLEQCLLSVERSVNLQLCTKDNVGNFDVYVVDNNSIDGSVEMVNEKFPWVKLIANKDNVGFSKANNMAIRQSNAEYILLLNPDTLIETDTLSKCLEFMDNTPEAGGLGVKMIDGEGKYLPESKRGLPTPAVSFYKISGLCKLFPKSERYAHYYLGHLSKDDISEIEVLSGAFMMMRKTTLDKVGLLDEAFFMYGEDVDLSYRIILGGYKNYYYPETRIIHYKGESTKKGSLNYVLVFYKAMALFAKKHFGSQASGIYMLLIQFAIWGRAFIALFSRFGRNLSLPILDFISNYVLLYGLSIFWAEFYFNAVDHFTPFYRGVVLCIYAFVFMMSVLALKGYKKTISIRKTIYGYGLGIGILLVMFYLLGTDWQFSRFMIVIGGIACGIVGLGIRALLSNCFKKSFVLGTKSLKNYLIVGSNLETDRAKLLLVGKGVPEYHIQTVGMDGIEHKIEEIIRINNISEVIFCAKDIDFSIIMEVMTKTKNKGINCKIISPEGEVMVGSKITY